MATFLSEQGYEASALAGGYDAWVEAGYETEPKDGAAAGSGE